MAMNKKEQAEFAAMKRELLVARAFNRTQPVAPDVAPPNPNDMKAPAYTIGYRASKFTYTNPGAEMHWSTATSHGRGERTSRVSGSQNSIWLHSTPVLALRSLRYETEERMARELAEIDEAIAAATQQQKEG